VLRYNSLYKNFVEITITISKLIAQTVINIKKTI